MDDKIFYRRAFAYLMTIMVIGIAVCISTGLNPGVYITIVSLGTICGGLAYASAFM